MAVIDRYRLVLEIFADRARSRRAQLEVELARLRYALPRIKASGDPDRLNIILETGTQYHDVKRRITRLEPQLANTTPVEVKQMQRRREQGFDLVALVGDTNGGKTTLLRRLADEMDFKETAHPDLAITAGTENRLFKTLETTTRKSTMQGGGSC